MEVSKRIFNLETETAFSILAKANNLAAKGKDIINLGIGQPDFPTPINIQEAAIKAIKDGYHGYTPSNGCLLYTSPSPRDRQKSRMPSSA